MNGTGVVSTSIGWSSGTFEDAGREEGPCDDFPEPPRGRPRPWPREPRLPGALSVVLEFKLFVASVRGR